MLVAAKTGGRSCSEFEASLVSCRFFTSFIYLSIAWNTVTIAMNDISVDRSVAPHVAVDRSDALPIVLTCTR